MYLTTIRTLTHTFTLSQGWHSGYTSSTNHKILLKVIFIAYPVVYQFYKSAYAYAPINLPFSDIKHVKCHPQVQA